MPLYQFTTIRAAKNEDDLQLTTLFDFVWSPTSQMVKERAAVVSAEMFPGTTLQGTVVAEVSIKRVIRSGLRYAWIKLKPRFK